MSIDNHIEGSLVLKTPMHVAEFGEKGKTMQKQTFTRDGRFMQPYFPANDFRGRARRKAASRIFAAWKKKGLSVSEKLYLGLTCGTSSGNPESDKTIEEIARANQNIYMGLFGGGTRMLRSGFRVQDLDVITQTNIDAGVVPTVFGEGEGFVPTKLDFESKQVTPVRHGGQLMTTFNMVRVDDIVRMARPEELEAIIAGGAEAIAQHQESIFGARVDTKDAKAKKEAAGKNEKEDAKKPRIQVENMMSFEAISSGISMYLRLDMSDALTDAQKGFLILVLHDLLVEGEFGGYVRNGLGKLGVNELKIVSDGCASYPVYADAENLVLSPEALRLTAIAQAEIDALTVSEMEAFFTPRKPAEAE